MRYSECGVSMGPGIRGMGHIGIVDAGYGTLRNPWYGTDVLY